MERKKKMNESDLGIWRERKTRTPDDSRKVSQPLFREEGKGKKWVCPETWSA